MTDSPTFNIPQLVKSLPIYKPEDWKRYPSRRNLPVKTVIGSNPREVQGMEYSEKM